ncbi:transposase [Streptomyces sp. NPDC050516]|uniref:IS110 family transposase n=1 Tax=Streptomyces sp. NPDC050516 TaxID=3365621 RepID=UPI0037A2B5D1
MAQTWAGTDIGKTHHRCVVRNAEGEWLLSRRVLNDEPELLTLLADVLALDEDVVWAVDVAEGMAALWINVLLNHGQHLVYIPGLAVNRASAGYRGMGKTVNPLVPNPAQVARLFAAVAQQPGRGPHLEAFFGCMYYAAMRPAEVIHLRFDQCHLPETGWGMLNLSGGVVTAGKEWTDDGALHEVHSLKRRAATATRPVPIPPQFVRTLLAHVERFGVAPDGPVFRNQADSYVEAAAYGMTWARARKYVLTRTELASGLAKRPYDLRHAGISFWLYFRCRPGRMRSPCGPEHRGPLPSLRQVPGRRPGAGQPPHRAVHGGVGARQRRVGRHRAESGFGPEIDRNSWSEVG